MEMKQEALSGTDRYQSYVFSENGGDNGENRSGKQILEYFRYLRRYENIVGEVDKFGGIDEYMYNNAINLAARLETFNEKIKKYYVRVSE